MQHEDADNPDVILQRLRTRSQTSNPNALNRLAADGWSRAETQPLVAAAPNGEVIDMKTDPLKGALFAHEGQHYQDAVVAKTVFDRETRRIGYLARTKDLAPGNSILHHNLGVEAAIFKKETGGIRAQHPHYHDPSEKRSPENRELVIWDYARDVISAAMLSVGVGGTSATVPDEQTSPPWMAVPSTSTAKPHEMGFDTEREKATKQVGERCMLSPAINMVISGHFAAAEMCGLKNFAIGLPATHVAFAIGHILATSSAGMEKLDPIGVYPNVTGHACYDDDHKPKLPTVAPLTEKIKRSRLIYKSGLHDKAMWEIYTAYLEMLNTSSGSHIASQAQHAAIQIATATEAFKSRCKRFRNAKNSNFKKAIEVAKDDIRFYEKLQADPYLAAAFMPFVTRDVENCDNQRYACDLMTCVATARSKIQKGGSIATLYAELSTLAMAVLPLKSVTKLMSKVKMVCSLGTVTSGTRITSVFHKLILVLLGHYHLLKWVKKLLHEFNNPEEYDDWKVMLGPDPGLVLNKNRKAIMGMMRRSIVTLERMSTTFAVGDDLSFCCEMFMFMNRDMEAKLRERDYLGFKMSLESARCTPLCRSYDPADTDRSETEHWANIAATYNLLLPLRLEAQEKDDWQTSTFVRLARSIHWGGVAGMNGRFERRFEGPRICHVLRGPIICQHVMVDTGAPTDDMSTGNGAATSEPTPPKMIAIVMWILKHTAVAGYKVFETRDPSFLGKLAAKAHGKEGEGTPGTSRSRIMSAMAALAGTPPYRAAGRIAGGVFALSVDSAMKMNRPDLAGARHPGFLTKNMINHMLLDKDELKDHVAAMKHVSLAKLLRKTAKDLDVRKPAPHKLSRKYAGD